MIGVPVGLLLLSLVGFFSFSQDLLAQSQKLYEITRYVSLADVDPIEAERYLSQQGPQLQFDRISSSGICVNRISKEVGFDNLFRFTISREAVCEADK